MAEDEDDVDEVGTVEEVAFEVEPLPPPGPSRGSSVFLLAAFTVHSAFRCSLLPQLQQRLALSLMPSQLCSHLHDFPARQPASDEKNLQGFSAVAFCFILVSAGEVVAGGFASP